MSNTSGPDYGFVMCRLKSRADVIALENALCGKTNVYTTGVTLPFDDGTITQLVAAFKQRWPAVEIKPRDIKQTAIDRDMTEMEVLQSLSLVELYVPNDGTGAFFEVFADTLLISIPYSHKAPRIDCALHRVWEYLDMVEREVSCVTFDPQHRRVLDLGRDFDGVKTKYELLAQQSARPNGRDGRSSQWWKLW